MGKDLNSKKEKEEENKERNMKSHSTEKGVCLQGSVYDELRCAGTICVCWYSIFCNSAGKVGISLLSVSAI